MTAPTPNGAAAEVMRILSQSSATELSTEEIYAASETIEDRTQLTKAIHYLRQTKGLIDTRVDQDGIRWHRLVTKPVSTPGTVITAEDKDDGPPPVERPPIKAIPAPKPLLRHKTTLSSQSHGASGPPIQSRVIRHLLEAINAQADAINNPVMTSLVMALSAAIEV